MNTRAVQESVRQLPANSAAYRANPPIFGRKTINPPLAAHTRWAEATNDPQWFWRIAQSYHLSQEPLPAFIHDRNIRRAYHYLRGNPDDQMAIAHAMHSAYEFSCIRQTIRGLLCARDISIEGISTLLGWETEIVRLFEALFFNVRNCESFLGVNQAYPLTRLGSVVENEKGYDDAERTLMRLGRDYGWREVARFAGVLPIEETNESSETALADMERTIVANARMLARAGHLNRPDSPGIRHGKALMMRPKKDTDSPQTADDKIGLGSLGMKANVLEHFRRISQPDVDYRLHLQRQQIMREQDAEAKRAAANQ